MVLQTHGIKAWGYCQHNGPATWGENFPLANGHRQSPIDIVTDSCLLNDQLNPLRYEYSKKSKTLVNTGAGWKVNVVGAGSVLEGGPLEGKYKLEQFHCHWGTDNSCGSEHTVDGKSYPAEIHLVHWNCEKYSSFDEAVDKEDGLVVLGIFFQVGDHNETLSCVTDLLHRVPHKDDIIPMEYEIDPAKFIPENPTYWTYPGSLTTPPCLESVTWIVFKNPIDISEKQLEIFRSLYNYGRLDRTPEEEFRGKILANYRPPLELGEREVQYCQLG